MSDLDPGVRQDETNSGDAPLTHAETMDTAQPETLPSETAPNEPVEALDLDEIERDLRDVESTLARLADGTYFPQPDHPAEPRSAAVDSDTGRDA